MSYTIQEWEHRIKMLEGTNLKKIRESLHILNNWDYFSNAYSEVRTIENLVKHEEKIRTKIGGDRENI